VSGGTKLQAEIAGLHKTVTEAARNPFLPASARDAIVQAGYVIATLAKEVEQLRARGPRYLRFVGRDVDGRLLRVLQSSDDGNEWRDVPLVDQAGGL
jgi:hypothetical protein